MLAAQFTFARCAGLVGAIACFASLAAALAGEPKPDAAIKTKTFEARVFTPEGAKIFGGAQPKGDDDGQR